MTVSEPSGGAEEEGPQRSVPRRGTRLELSFRHLAALFVLALVVRAGYGGLRMSRSGDAAALSFPDEQQYWLMSRELRAGGLLTDELGFHATRMPLYPGLLALFPSSTAGVVGAKACHWFLGALVGPLVALLGARALGAGVGLVAGVIAAVDLSLVGLSSLVLSETAFVTVLAGLWWVSWPLINGGGGTCLAAGSPREGLPPLPPGRWGRWVLTGVLSALCVYLRPSTAGLVLVWTAVLVIRQGVGGYRAWAGGAVVVGVVVLSLVPWAARNRRVTGHWCWLTYRAGISLYDGVGPQATGAGDLGAIKSMPAVAGLDEAAWNRWFVQASWDSIRSDPLRVFRLAGVKLARTWSPVLHAEELRSTSIRVLFAVWSIALFALALGGVLAWRRRPAVVLGLLVPALYLSVLHSVFVGSVRYRAGAIPGLAVLAAFALMTIARRRKAC